MEYFIYFICAILGISVLFLRDFIGKKKMDKTLKSPVLSEHARVYIKEHSAPGHGFIIDYYIYFFISEHDNVVKCHVPKTVYFCLEKGDWGTLTYQDVIFISFEKDGGDTVYSTPF